MGCRRFQLFAATGLLAATTLGALPGCAQSGPITARRNTVGSLKASVSQLEYDNTNLRKQVADLKSDTSRADEELAQERSANGELSARLDDAKDAIRRQGGDVTALNRPTTSSKASTASTEEEIPAPAQSPVRRSRGSRKPPAAQIPRIETRPDHGPGGFEPGSDRFDPGPQASRIVDDGRWLPVARGTGRHGSVEIR